MEDFHVRRCVGGATDDGCQQEAEGDSED
jgi:hypothetical protein